MAKQSVSIFDKRSFGGWLMGDRKASGYTSADAFASAVTEKTGYPVTGRTILNLENGKHEPCLSLVLAISYTLYGRLLSDEVVRHVRTSADIGFAVAQAFPEYDRSEYRGATLSDSDVGIYVGGDEFGNGGEWVMRPNPLNMTRTEGR